MRDPYPVSSQCQKYSIGDGNYFTNTEPNLGADNQRGYDVTSLNVGLIFPAFCRSIRILSERTFWQYCGAWRWTFLVVAPCGPLLVSSTGDAGWSESVVSGPDNWLIPRPHKGCRLLEIAGRWPRRLESAQECVTTHLPKRATPKTDDAKASAIEEHHTWNWFFLCMLLISCRCFALMPKQKQTVLNQKIIVTACRRAQGEKWWASKNTGSSLFCRRAKDLDVNLGQSSPWCRS